MRDNSIGKSAPSILRADSSRFLPITLVIVADHHERYPVCVTKLDTMKVSKMILVEARTTVGRSSTYQKVEPELDDDGFAAIATKKKKKLSAMM